MKILRGRSHGAPTTAARDTFVGEVLRDPVFAADGVVVNTIVFHPGSRTYWHRHEKGQILQVVAGTGIVCTQGESPQLVRAGDTVWVPPLEVHWHGGTADTMMVHVAISLGKTEWFAEVTDSHPELAALLG